MTPQTIYLQPDDGSYTGEPVINLGTWAALLFVGLILLLAVAVARGGR